ncbi:MAG: hypothetical protein JW883_15805 [Deltaproteobacteria bacterium]|nr:hypothetical protein [Deltaproteobacteria bacterium]
MPKSCKKKKKACVGTISKQTPHVSAWADSIRLRRNTPQRTVAQAMARRRLAAGNYTVTFRVTDNGSPLQSDSEEVTITVSAGDYAPANPVNLRIVGE